jgi:leucyl aminopeptidase
MTPTLLAENAVKAAKGIPGLKVTVWDKARIKKERFGGLLAVAAGSDQEPRFIIMEYNGAGKGQKPICFVGKGLTFDCGGISIKPSASMEEMKYDMCGGAAVIATLLALAKLKAKVNVIGLVPSSENLAGPSATKPGDVYFARNGKSVEVFNTDAEGRLILGDALAYGSEQKPAAMFDTATLTGAILVALGNTHTGVFSRDPKLVKRIQEAADASGELVWPMPLTDFHVDDMKGTHADLCNISGNRLAGSATAAAFLEQFVEPGIPWAHFDIAGTAWNVSSRFPYHPRKCASGIIVRTFVELAESF